MRYCQKIKVPWVYEETHLIVNVITGENDGQEIFRKANVTHR